MATLAATVSLLACCGRAPDRSAAPSAGDGDSGAEAAFPMPSARRPTRQYYFERTEGRCVVLSVDEGRESPRSTVPCPRDLFDGERIRLVGKTCMRESQDARRREPLVCPEPLNKLEDRTRAAGTTAGNPEKR